MDVAGVWSGTYSCEAMGGPECSDEGGPITLTVFQSESTAAYVDDGRAFYLGQVCGDSFDYAGGGFGYRESGTFTLVGDGVATKTSHYVGDDGVCEGDCQDDLQLE